MPYIAEDIYRNISIPVRDSHVNKGDLCSTSFGVVRLRLTVFD